MTETFDGHNCQTQNILVLDAVIATISLAQSQLERLSQGEHYCLTLTGTTLGSQVGAVNFNLFQLVFISCIGGVN